MSLLLDTHALIWAATKPSRFRPAVIARLRDEAIFVSVVSAYEMTFKHMLGKLPVANRLLADLPNYLDQQRYEVLPVTLAHAEAAGRLTADHRDPFDRLLAAQALIDDLTLVSSDVALDLFGVKRLW